jgi:hypothetical protein
MAPVRRFRPFLDTPINMVVAAGLHVELRVLEAA